MRTLRQHLDLCRLKLTKWLCACRRHHKVRVLGQTLRSHHHALVRSSSLVAPNAEVPADVRGHVNAVASAIASFDSFDITAVATRSAQPLRVVAVAAFERLGLAGHPSINMHTLCDFAEAIEGLYR